MKSNRENIVKALECCHLKSEDCISCPFVLLGENCANLERDAVTLIKELTEENDKLKSDLKDAEEEYEHIYEQAEADIRGNMADGGTSCNWCIAGHRADAIRQIQDRLAMHFGTYTDKTEVKVVDVFKLMGQIAEEMLEENNV